VTPETAGGGLAGPTGAALAGLIRVVAADLLERKDELNRLDGVAGDGDLGLTVTTGARALLDLAASLETMPEADAIRRCGTEIARRAPSTGGTLIACGLLAAAKAAVDPAAGGVARAAAYLEAAADSIAQRGQVAPGDRTMLDALGPAADAMRAATDGGDDAGIALEKAARAADAGAKATATMVAKVGRAGWLADRAAGHEDAGARLVAMAVDAAARAVTTSSRPPAAGAEGQA
jgi:dihydroxyacetone kinase